MAGSPKRLEFPYGRTVFLQRLLLLTAAGGALLVFISVIAVATPGEWKAGIAALLAVYVIVSGGSPLLTNHWLTTTRLILRQGWYFRAVIPLREIAEVSPFGGSPKVGLTAEMRRRRLFVAGSKEGLVWVRLRTPRRFWQVLGASVDEIVFDVDARDRFLEAFRGRMALLAPVQTERADSELWD